MKIVVATSGTLKESVSGGHEVRIFQLFKRLSMENEVHVVQVAEEDMTWTKDRLIIHNLSPTGGRFGRYLYNKHFFIARYLFAFRVSKAIRSIGPDVADINSWAFPISGKEYSVVATCALMPMTSSVASYIGRLSNRVDLSFLRYKMRKADHIIYLSKQMEEKFRYYQSKLKKKATYVPNGIDIDVFHPKDKSACRNKHEIPQDKRVILYCSRLEHYKRPYDFLNAFKAMGSEYMGVVAGNGPLLEDIREWVLANGLKDRLIVIGEVDQQSLSELYSASDVIIYPGELEIQPLVPQEAMACGTVPIVSDTLGNNEIVQHNFNGLVVKLGDISGLAQSVKLLFNDNALYESLRKNGLEYMKNRTWENASKITFAVYEDLILHSVSESSV